MTGGRLQDRTILIMGGTSGLGLSAAQACIDQGARLVVVGRSDAKCRAAVERFGDRVRTVTGDAADAATAERAIRAAHDAFNGFDGLYHVAGGSGRSQGDGPLHELTDSGWSHTLRINLDSVGYSNRAAVRDWLARGCGGVILNMSSVLGFAPAPRYFATHAYAAAKAAIIGLSKSAAAFYAPRNIRINVLAPALIDTPMSQRAMGDTEIMNYVAARQPLDGGRVGCPADVDQAVVFLLSDESRFVTGQVLAIDGGWCLSEGSSVPHGE